MNHRHHKFFIGISAIFILIIGLFFGILIESEEGLINLEIINLSLLLTIIVLILMFGGLDFKVYKMLIENRSKSKKKRRL